MNNNKPYLRVYDEKLDLLYEMKLNSSQYNSAKVTEVLSRSKVFLHVGDLTCYRVVPKLK